MITPRQGEGALVNIELRTDARADGTSVSGIAFDISQAPVPDRQYAANLVNVEFEDDGVLFMIAQRKIRSGELRSLLLIPMPVERAEQFLESVDAMAQPSISQILEMTHTRRGEVTTIGAEPEQTYVLPANIVGVALSGAEACMDFYHVSSYSIMAVKGGAGKLAVNPVVRVLLHTGLFVAMVERLRSVLNKHTEHTEGERHG